MLVPARIRGDQVLSFACVAHIFVATRALTSYDLVSKCHFGEKLVLIE